MLTRAILLVTLAAFYFGGIVRAGHAPKLAGSILKTEDAVKKSGAIFLGKMALFGSGGAIGPGEREIFGNRVRVSQYLKSSFDDRSTVTLHQMTDLGEQMPGPKSLYIFFISKNAQAEPDPFAVLKLLPATKENIVTVTKLISN